MIKLTDINGRSHYLAPNNIARTTEAGASSKWHGICALVKTHDGVTLEVRETADQIAALITKTVYAQRYAWLRERDLDTIHQGGVFAGMTPNNIVLNGEDLDAAIDLERGAHHG